MTDLIRNVSVPEGQRGLWRIERFTVDEKGAQAHNLIAARDAAMTRRAPRSIVPGRYTRLWYDDEIVMSDTPAEMREHLPIVRAARGRVLINGLALYGFWISGPALFIRAERPALINTTRSAGATPNKAASRSTSSREGRSASASHFLIG